MDMWTEDWKDLAEACMAAINKDIESLPGLSSAYHIGPAYFKKLNNYMKNDPEKYPDFFKLWDNHLYGVIFEYLRGKKDAEKTIKELLIEWWTGNTTTKLPIPTIYTYEVDVDGKTITIESMSRSRMYIHYQARKKYPNAK